MEASSVTGGREGWKRAVQQEGWKLEAEQCNRGWKLEAEQCNRRERGLEASSATGGREGWKQSSATGGREGWKRAVQQEGERVGSKQCNRRERGLEASSVTASHIDAHAVCTSWAPCVSVSLVSTSTEACPLYPSSANKNSQLVFHDSAHPYTTLVVVFFCMVQHLRNVEIEEGRCFPALAD